MLYFSKFRIVLISLLSLIFILIASSNFFKFDDSFFDKKINLGLDLQGGSYLLLEIDNSPVIEQKLQNLTIIIKNFFKEKNVRVKNLKISNQNLFFSVDNEFKQIVLDSFNDKESVLNPYYPRFKSHQLNITEVKNLNIVQLVLYKNLKVELSSVSIDGIKLSSQSLQVSSNKDTRILWSSPNIWLVLSKKENILKIIEEECPNENFATTDISHSRAVIQINGPKSKEVLKKGCPINFNDFKKNNCVGSVFNGINIIIDCIDHNPQEFNLITLRSFGESFYHHITDASLEFGYIGV